MNKGICGAVNSNKKRLSEDDREDQLKGGLPGDPGTAVTVITGQPSLTFCSDLAPYCLAGTHRIPAFISEVPFISEYLQNIPCAGSDFRFSWDQRE